MPMVVMRIRSGCCPEMIMKRGLVLGAARVCLTASVLTTGVLSNSARAQAEPKAEPPAWSVTYNQEHRYISWSGTRGTPANFANGQPGKGSQFYMPFGLELAGQPHSDVKVELLLRSGYVQASQRSAGGLSGSVSTYLDTTLGGTVTYLGFAGIQPYVSMNISLPTGRSVLWGNSAFARMDPDLVDVPTYGEGFNFGPTAGVNIPLADNLLIGLGVGYTNRGAYERDSVLAGNGVSNLTLPLSRFNPGDSVSYNASVAYAPGPWTLNAALTYVTTTRTTLDGGFAGRPRPTISLSGGAAYQWDERNRSSLTASWSFTGRNDILDPALQIVAEPFNSNSNIYRLAFDQTYKLNEDWTIGLTGSWLYRDANAYLPISASFVPAKTRWSAGAVAQYAVNKAIGLNARVERIWIRERDKPDVIDIVNCGGVCPGSAVPALNYDGWLVSLGGTVQF